MSLLSASDFTTFFREVHGPEPFMWQLDLLDQVVQQGWPKVIDVPTGAGKTACIDVALFALALAAHDESLDRHARRIVMVVDRRVVVDQATRRARKIARALMPAPSNSVTARVACRLASLSSESVPLRVATLRGGIPRDHGWIRTPDQPLVIASTVDQLGSRLLFRGYGVRSGMRPVHAGLLGNDCLVLLDEVHLSRPFEQTLTAVSELRQTGYPAGALQVVALSATPGGDDKSTFRLNDAQKDEERLAVRLNASKPATLHVCDGRDALAGKAVERATAFLDGGHRSIAVVVNRVDSAHAITRRLRERLGADPCADVQLLTGRMRPLDRDDRVRDLEPRLAAIKGRRKVDSDARPVIIVATQCIEAGADFDFDALATEHASLDALRQRFGRLDRLGEYGRAQASVIAVQELD
jgi:CRISPR-associated endonuclease/helicase Cas3